MADLEKVIKGLEYCLRPMDEYVCSMEQTDKCPYHGSCFNEELPFAQIHSDALELLKAQEPVKPEIINGLRFYKCGACGNGLWVAGQRYCGCCGRAVKWDG